MNFIMPVIDEQMEYDDDDMDQESLDTGNDSGSSGSASDEDEGELDVVESDQRRTECLEKMADLEQQFYQLREHLFKEKTAQVTEKLKEVQAGTAKEYKEPVQRYNENLTKRQRIADIRLELQKKNIANKKDGEIQSAKQTLENNKNLIYDEMLQEIEDKISRLKQDRHNTDITSDILGEAQPSRKKRPNSSAMNDKRRRPVAVSGPYIVYNLSEDKILDDYRAIKMALKQRREEPLLLPLTALR